MSIRTTRLFDAGSAALARTLNAEGLTAEAGQIAERFPDGAYACPCCLIAYGRDRQTDQPRTLTDDHVPPKLAGGVRLLLTCAGCNNESGRVWDHHASRQQELHDAIFGTREPTAVTAIIDGVPIRGTLNPTESTRGRESNDPLVLAEGVTRFEAALDAKKPFDVQIGGHKPIDITAAAWGWIRAAYLTAFAVYGYRYALLRVLTPIRQQLADPRPVDAPTLLASTTAPSGTRRMFLVREPEPLRALMVDFGHLRVFLPAPDFPQAIDDLATGVATLTTDTSLRLLAQEVPWPTEPLYRLDSGT